MELVTIYIVSNYLLARVVGKRCFCSYNSYKIIGDFRDVFTCYEGMKIAPADMVLIESDLFDFQEIEIIKAIKDEFPSTKIIVKTSPKSKEKTLFILSCGINGYIVDSDIEIQKVMEVASKGGFWLDVSIARYLFNSLSDINTQATEKIKENKRLKNSLTQRELEVLKLITEGKTNSQIAQEIIVSTNTAKAHVGSILSKLSVNDRVQAAVKAVKANLF